MRACSVKCVKTILIKDIRRLRTIILLLNYILTLACVYTVQCTRTPPLYGPTLLSPHSTGRRAIIEMLSVSHPAGEPPSHLTKCSSRESIYTNRERFYILPSCYH